MGGGTGSGYGGRRNGNTIVQVNYELTSRKDIPGDTLYKFFSDNNNCGFLDAGTMNVYHHVSGSTLVLDNVDGGTTDAVITGKVSSIERTLKSLRFVCSKKNIKVKAGKLEEQLV